ncbi:myosin light chain kinase A-like isoform X2 [Ptychodera flava]|uniref:myosin light chain kinase A-like isoform X2 n=1 Tax=Ptychodera flava TaxID=63121 RepID=UPI00396AA03E
MSMDGSGDSNSPYNDSLVFQVFTNNNLLDSGERLEDLSAFPLNIPASGDAPPHCLGKVVFTDSMSSRMELLKVFTDHWETLPENAMVHGREEGVIFHEIPLEVFKRYKDEALIWAKLEHPHIVPLYGVLRDGKKICYLMKYIDKVGTPYKTSIEEEKELAGLLCDIVNALMYLHCKDIIHGDIKEENVLINRNKTDAYLIDFGLSRQLLDAEEFIENMDWRGTRLYMAPEIARYGRYGKTMDVWCTGLLLVVYIFGLENLKQLFFSPSFENGFHSWKDTLLSVISGECSPDLFSFIEDCVEVDYQERMSVFQCYNHRFLKSREVVIPVFHSDGYVPISTWESATFEDLLKETDLTDKVFNSVDDGDYFTIASDGQPTKLDDVPLTLEEMRIHVEPDEWLWRADRYGDIESNDSSLC